MSEYLATLGLDFRLAPTSVRAAVSQPLDATLFEALTRQGLSGLVELHTCARSLWVLSAPHPAWVASLFQAAIGRKCGVMPQIRVGAPAIGFALRVAAGLEAHLQGESDVGRQILYAFEDAKKQSHTDSTLNLIEQAIHRLLSRGRALGFIRPNRGLGALAVDRLQLEGLPPAARVGVVGTGAIGQRTAASLVRAGHTPVLFNRTPREPAHPLDQLPALLPTLDALVVCTAGPPGWLTKPALPVIDLGLPPQCEGAINLDILLSGPGIRLSPGQLAVAEAMVDQETELCLEKLSSASWRRGLSSINELRDQFVATTLPQLLEEGLPELGEDTRNRVLSTTSRILRSYNHSLLTCIKEDFFR